MHTIPYLQETISQAFDQLELPLTPRELYDPIHYTLSLGGKRIRPLLVLLAADLFDGKAEDALPAAIGLELFHNFTLLHDDLMDKAPLRRGKETVYRKWGENTAILSGDTMFALAGDYLARMHPSVLPAVLPLFHRTAREVCEGQQMDMNFETMEDVSIDDYILMIRMKTAVLLGCCLQTGSLAAGAGNNDAETLYNYGVHLGIAFQIQDDLLDAFGSEATFGKKTGGDIIACKKTFLYLKALETAGVESRKKLMELYRDTLLDDEYKILSVKAMMSELHIPDLCNAETDRWYQKAITYLDKVSLPDHRKAALREFGDRLMERKH
ncbi:MAG TPA: polyprenyl synthetase family protein [Bacteroidales bacterium]|nr:polyprenyl synthetase family protein [Bacteroidales bacterium]HSA43941.1 polyprenyl synthetase family protein [Bacteroidales bacterium]